TVEVVAPGVIGTDKPVTAIAAVAVGNAGGAVSAHIVEAAHRAIGATQRDEALAENVERVVTARVPDVVEVADDMPALREQMPALRLEEALLEVEPRWKALVRQDCHAFLRRISRN